VVRALWNVHLWVSAMKILTLMGMNGGLQVSKSVQMYCDAEKALRKIASGPRRLADGETLDQASTLALRTI
jgi:hypothetical protein